MGNGALPYGPAYASLLDFTVSTVRRAATSRQQLRVDRTCRGHRANNANDQLGRRRSTGSGRPRRKRFGETQHATALFCYPAFPRHRNTVDCGLQARFSACLAGPSGVFFRASDLLLSLAGASRDGVLASVSKIRESVHDADRFPRLALHAAALLLHVLAAHFGTCCDR